MRNTMMIMMGGLATLLAGCTTEPEQKETPADGPQGAELYRFNSCAEMRSTIADTWTETLANSYYGYGYYYGDVALEDDAEASDGDGGGRSDGPDDYSETNTQEAGVDEPDMVKTNGEHIYIVQQGELVVVDSWPAESTAVIASQPLAGSPYSMFLRDDELVVFSYDYGVDVFIDTEEDWYSYATRVMIFDVSDPAAPALSDEFFLEGNLTDARRIDNDVYVVTNDWGDLPYNLWRKLWDREFSDLPELDYDAPEAERDAALVLARETFRPIVEEALSEIPTAHLLPRYSDDGVTAQPLMGCRDVFRPEVMNSTSTLAMAHLDLDNLDAGPSGSAVMSDGWTVYASQDHLYVSQTSSNWNWGWWGEDEEYQLETRIHRFSLEGADSVYEGSGSVQGWLLNQFSMSEHEDHLRVATSDLNWWGNQSDPANNVYVLELENGGLDVVGEITDIAPGERIYSARFMGDKGYLVTFEQIDPLFTLDLSEPTNPQVIGELKIPGFSSYLHPIGDDHLLAVGMDGTDEGVITGLAVSLFNVSDFANPALQDKYTFATSDWSFSEALYDHHAFTYHRETLAIPAYNYDWDDGEYFSGILSLDVDLEAGLTEIGQIDHADMVADSECLYGGWEDCEEYYWYAWMRRGVIIEDNLYSISDYGVKVTNLNDPSEVKARVLFNPR
ncbi:MAG: beta-propeller domain-containing protein [Myxococcota bacterium]